MQQDTGMFYDVLVAGVLLFAVVRGAMKGFVWQVATIAALVLCFAFSGTLSQAIAPYITLQPPLNRWVAMFGLYIGFSFLSFGVARWLKGWIDKAQFVEYDRHLGSIFGFIKGVVFVLVMTFFGVTLTQKMPETRLAIFHSQTGKLAAVVMDRLHPVMPDELHDVLEPYIHSLDRPELDLHAHGGEHDHAGEHSHKGHDLEPLEAPPFPTSPHRGNNEPPPFESIIGRETGLPSDPDFFDLPSPPSPPDNTPNRPASSSNLRAERERLLGEVAGVFSDHAEAQQAIVNQTDNSLAGLPAEIKNRVATDWHNDMLFDVRGRDPDPNTAASTSFDARILRPLEQGNVPINTLSSALQDRLQRVRR
jgi:membrane protein required for colicin V production